MAQPQYVCLACGYNMIGDCPETCPFCGAGRDQFLTWQDCSARFRVEATPVSERVSRLNTVPRLGIEHAVYRIEAGAKTFWIDCPSSFDRRLARVDVITFTHRDFLGASNQYRELFGAEVWIHRRDGEHDLARPFPFDRLFAEPFEDSGLEAHPIGGHSPGFTAYIFEDLLFPCDLVFPDESGMRFNPYGPAGPTLKAAGKLQRLLEGRRISKVCGWDYVADYGAWKDRFDELIG
jgi:hypothetical protein